MRGNTPNDGLDLAQQPVLAAADFSNVPIPGCGLGAFVGFESQATLHAAGGLHLDQIANLPQTTRLFARDTLVRGQDLHYLSTLPVLKEVNLREVILRDEDLCQLQQCQKLTELRLAQTPITDAGVEALGQLLGRLELLDLEGTPVTDAALIHVANCRKMKRLWLEGTLVTDDGLRHLAALPNLQTIRLPVEGIRGPGLHHLLDLPQLPVINFAKDTHAYWRIHPHTPPAPLTASEVRCFIPLANALADSPNPEPRDALYSRYDHDKHAAFMPQDPHESLLIYLLAEFELTPEALELLPDSGRALLKLQRRE